MWSADLRVVTRNVPDSFGPHSIVNALSDFAPPPLPGSIRTIDRGEGFPFHVRVLDFHTGILTLLGYYNPCLTHATLLQPSDFRPHSRSASVLPCTCNSSNIAPGLRLGQVASPPSSSYGSYLLSLAGLVFASTAVPLSLLASILALSAPIILSDPITAYSHPVPVLTRLPGSRRSRRERYDYDRLHRQRSTS